MAQANKVSEGCVVDYTAVAAIVAGDVIKLPDGRAAVVPTAVDAARLAGACVEGIFRLAKSTSIAFLKGGDVYWDVSASKANFRADTGTPDFYVGVALEDAAAAATTILVALNVRTRHNIDMERGEEMVAVSTGASTCALLPGGAAKNNLIATNEAEALVVAAVKGFPISAKAIVEFRARLVSATGANEDFEWGVIDVLPTTLATVESSNAFASFHNDGDDLVIDTESDDGTTDRPILSTGISHVAADYSEYWIDMRDDANILFYIDGVLVDTSAAKRILTAKLTTVVYPFFAAFKLSSTDVSESRLSRLRARYATE